MKDRLSIFCPIRIVIIGEKDPRTVVVKYVDVTDNRYPKYLQKLMYNHCLRFDSPLAVIHQYEVNNHKNESKNVSHLMVYFLFQAPEWYKCEKAKSSKTPDQELKIKVAIRMDKPMNMKHCG